MSEEVLFLKIFRFSLVVPVFKNVGERSIAKNYRTVNLLSVATKVFVKLANNNVINNIGKRGFRSSRSTSDLLTVVSDRIA